MYKCLPRILCFFVLISEKLLKVAKAVAFYSILSTVRALSCLDRNTFCYKTSNRGNYEETHYESSVIVFSDGIKYQKDVEIVEKHRLIRGHR